MKKVKVLLLLSIGVLLSFSPLTANVSYEFNTSKVVKTTTASYSEEEIKSNVMNSNHVLANAYEASVQYFVKDNLDYGRKGVSKTIGRTRMYFPIIEQYLNMYLSLIHISEPTRPY